MDVLQGSPAHAGRRPVSLRPARAGVTDPDHQHLGPKRLEAMQLLEVLFELLQERILEVEDALAALTDRVLVVLPGDLVVGGTGAEANRPQGTRDGEGVQGPVDGRAREGWLLRLDSGRDLVRRAVRTEGGDRIPDQATLVCVALPGAKRRLSHVL